MKKTILTTLITSALTASVFAQGTIAFKNGTGTALKFSTDGVTSSVLTKSGTTPAGAVAGSFGGITIDIFSAPTGTALTLSGSDFISQTTSLVNTLTGPSSPWTLSTTQLGSTAYLGSGVWTTTTITLNGNVPLDANAEILVIGFNGTLANSTAYGYSGEIFNGAVLPGTTEWTQGTGGGAVAPVNITSGAGGFDGLVMQSVVPIPEPTTMALGGLGAAALLLFRRRK